MKTFTPGPWHKRSSQLNGDFDFSIYADDPDIGVSQRTWIAEIRTVQPILASDGNARLIAAAPELLEALKECLGIIENEHTLVTTGEPEAEVRAEVYAARAAIAKATGE